MGRQSMSALPHFSDVDLLKAIKDGKVAAVEGL